MTSDLNKDIVRRSYLVYGTGILDVELIAISQVADGRIVAEWGIAKTGAGDPQG